jgi:hypothetical protein
MGSVHGALPAGCIQPNVSGEGTYYLCGNTWFSPAYGASGVYYKEVPTLRLRARNWRPVLPGLRYRVTQGLTMSPLTISVVVFACVLGGALIGIFIHSLLPDDHVGSDSKDAIRLGMGLVATTVALVLGLLISSAKNFYDTQNAEVTQLAADIVSLDRILAHYGPETGETRAALRNSVARQVEITWPRDDSDKVHYQPTAERAEAVLDAIQELSPKSDRQRALQAQALALAIQAGKTRRLMLAQATVSIPIPLLAMLVFWLIVLFVSFGLFVRPNMTVMIGLSISALAVCGAIFLILQLYQPYGGLIQVSSAPLRAAIGQLGQ